LNITWAPGNGSVLNRSANRYTTPLLSVRIVQPLYPKPFCALPWLLVVADVTWTFVHVFPPSSERNTSIGVGELPF
jgi:hypothetical protein